MVTHSGAFRSIPNVPTERKKFNLNSFYPPVAPKEKSNSLLEGVPQERMMPMRQLYITPHFHYRKSSKVWLLSRKDLGGLTDPGMVIQTLLLALAQRGEFEMHPPILTWRSKSSAIHKLEWTSSNWDKPLLFDNLGWVKRNVKLT